VTVDEALARAAQAFDDVAAEAIAASEATLRSRGATDEEVEIELQYLERDIDAARREALQHIRAIAESGVQVQ
jgi:hypothetical protein